MKKLTAKDFSFKCPMNWDEMTPSANGRYCNKCAKEVYDLTHCSLDEVRELQRKQGSICGMVRLVGAAAVAASLSSAACKQEEIAGEVKATSQEAGDPQAAAPQVVEPKVEEPKVEEPEMLLGDVCPIPEPEKPVKEAPPVEAPVEVVPEIQVMGIVCPPPQLPQNKDVEG